MLSFYTLATAWVVFRYSQNLAKGLSLLNLISQGGAALSPFGMGGLLRFYGSKGFIVWFFVGTAVTLGFIFMKMILHRSSPDS